MRKAWEILEQDGWTRWAHARDENGLACNVQSDHARCFCARGAIMRKHVEGLSFIEAEKRLCNISEDDPIRKDLTAANALFTARTKLTLVGYNDRPDAYAYEIISLLKEADI